MLGHCGGGGTERGVPRQLTPPQREIQSYRSRKKESEKEKQDRTEAKVLEWGKTYKYKIIASTRVQENFKNTEGEWHRMSLEISRTVSSGKAPNAKRRSLAFALKAKAAQKGSGERKSLA